MAINKGKFRNVHMCLLINVFVAIFIEKQQQYYSVEHLIKPYSIIDLPNDIAQHT